MLAALVLLGLATAESEAGKTGEPNDQGRVIAQRTTVYRALAMNWFKDFWRE
jgi:hypothetical protein